MDYIVKSEEQSVLDYIQSYAEAESCTASNIIDMCVTKTNVTAKVLTTLTQMFPLNICDSKDSKFTPLIYSAIIKGFENCKEFVIRRCSSMHMIEYITKHIAAEIVNVFCLKITFKNDYKWTIKKAIYDGVIPEKHLFLEPYRIVPVKENLKVKNMLKNDLTKCIMRKCNLLDKTGKKSRSYVEKNVKPVKTTSVSPVSQDCIIVQEAQ